VQAERGAPPPLIGGLRSGIEHGAWLGGGIATRVIGDLARMARALARESFRSSRVTGAAAGLISLDQAAVSPQKPAGPLVADPPERLWERGAAGRRPLQGNFRFENSPRMWEGCRADVCDERDCR
jgi:hypothetical protein